MKPLRTVQRHQNTSEPDPPCQMTTNQTGRENFQEIISTIRLITPKNNSHPCPTKRSPAPQCPRRVAVVRVVPDPRAHPQCTTPTPWALPHSSLPASQPATKSDLSPQKAEACTTTGFLSTAATQLENAAAV